MGTTEPRHTNPRHTSPMALNNRRADSRPGSLSECRTFLASLTRSFALGESAEKDLGAADQKVCATGNGAGAGALSRLTEPVFEGVAVKNNAFPRIPQVTLPPELVHIMSNNFARRTHILRK